MIKVAGNAKLDVRFEVNIPMSEEEWDALPSNKQDEILSEAIDWYEACRNSKVDEIDVWGVYEAKEGNL